MSRFFTTVTSLLLTFFLLNSQALSANEPISILNINKNFVTGEALLTPNNSIQQHIKPALSGSQAQLILKSNKNAEPKTTPQPSSKKKLSNHIPNQKNSNSPQKIAYTPNKKSVVQVQIRHDETASTLSFFWSSPVKAATYINANKLWIIFDKQADVVFLENSLNYFEGKRLTTPKIKNIVQKKLDNQNTFVVADIVDNASIKEVLARKKGNSWAIEVSSSASNIKLKDIKFKQLLNESLHLELQANLGEHCPAPIQFLDPFTSYDMTVFPFEFDLKGVRNPKTFIDLKLLETVQGLAIAHISDGLEFSPLKNNNLVISKKAGLNIAPELSTENQGNDLNSALIRNSHDAILDAKSQLVQGQSIKIRERQLIQQAGMIQPSLKAKANLNLALFYYANSFYREASAVLKLVTLQDPSLSKKHEFILLEAATNFCMENFTQAKNVISSIELEEVPTYHRAEFIFWKSVIYNACLKPSMYSFSTRTSQTFNEYKRNFLQHYSTDALSKIGFSLFEHQIHSSAKKEAKEILETIGSLQELNKHSQNQLNYSLARYHAVSQNHKMSMEHFNLCISDHSDVMHYYKCQYHRGLLLRETNLIDNEALIEVLERVRLGWKGDSFALSVLEKLSELYIEQSKIANALKIYQEMLDLYPNSVSELEIKSKMSQHFTRFFMDSAYHKSDLIQSLKIFFEFNYLLPIGKVGDEIILRVAEDLESLDLLDQHIVLLEHQVKNRLVGQKKQRALNHLARAYLHNGQYEKALGISKLFLTSKDLSEEMREERRYIAAKALCKLKREDEALKLLQDDFSLEADTIKGDIFWSRSDWKSYNDFSEPYLYSIRNDDSPLTDDQAKLVMKQAISYIYLKDYDLLKALNDDFKERITTTNKCYRAFHLLMSIAQEPQIVDKKEAAPESEDLYSLTSELAQKLSNSNDL